MEKNQNNSSELSSIVLMEIYQDYQKQKKRQKFYNRMYYAVIAFVIALIISFRFSMQGPSIEPKKEPFVGILSLDGEIGADQPISMEAYGSFIEEVFNNDQIVGVVLEISSPGGSAYESQMIYDKIAAMKILHPEKKVITHFKEIGASGGYLIGLSGDKIYAHSQSIVGSIGVIQILYDLSAFLNEHHLKVNLLKSHPLKAAGNPFEPLSEEAQTAFLSQLDYVYKNFTNLVELRRGERLSKDYTDAFSGLAWTGYEALKRGLIDECDISVEDFVKKEFGNYPAQYVEPKRPPFDMMRFLENLADRSGVHSAYDEITKKIAHTHGRYYYLAQ